MKKILLSAMALGLAATAANATETWILTKANKEYQVDTIYHATVGPGTTYTELKLKGEYDERVFYTTIDLTNENVDVRALKAGDNRVGRKTVPVIASDHDVAGEVTHFAGINSDFFNMEAPLYYTNGNSICNGLLHSYQNTTTWAHWLLTKDNEPMIAESMSYAPYLTLPNNGGTWYFYIGGTRGANQMRLYQYEAADGGTQTTKQNMYGSECVVVPVNGEYPFPVYTTEWEVISTPTVKNTTVGITIPANKYVLSGNGSAAAAVEKLKVGDRFTTTMNFKADGTAISTPMQVSGGNNILLKNGVHIDISASNAPRSFIGMNKDNTKVVLMAIDGRQTGWSDGVYYRLGAAIMEKVGCYNALEFDGGGSTTMYVKPLGGLMNKPSDGSMRTVACGVYAAAVCPNDWNVTKIEVKQKNIKLENGEKLTPVVYGYNKYGVMIDNNVANFTLEAPASLGTVSTDGKTLTASANGKGYQVLTVKYGQVKTTVPVKLPGEAGVDGVTVDDEDVTPEYFNLSGIKVDAPAAGLYIVRRGSKVSKEIVR